MMSAQLEATIVLFLQTARIPMALTSAAAFKAGVGMADLAQVIYSQYLTLRNMLHRCSFENCQIAQKDL